MFFVAQTVTMLVQIYIFLIVAQVAVSWLVVFKVLDIDNPQAQNLVALLKRVTDPVMKPVQKYVPPIAGIDLTPIVVIIGLQLLNSLVWRILL